MNASRIGFLRLLRVAASIGFFGGILSCARGEGSAPESRVAKPPASEPSGAPASREGRPAAPATLRIDRPMKRLTIREARRYMLALINRDRASLGFLPVELDEGPPTLAGQAHAEDMAKFGYLGHWGTVGSVPEQRHTEVGGVDMVLENALGFTDERKRELDP